MPDCVLERGRGAWNSEFYYAFSTIDYAEASDPGRAGASPLPR